MNSILRALEKIPYKVLWKFDKSEKEEQEIFPKNVMTQKWFPQQDILGEFLNSSVVYIWVSYL